MPNATSCHTKEAFDGIDQAAGLFSVAEDDFGDLFALFEAIRAASPANSMIHRLADFGARVAENDRDVHGRHKDEYNEMASRFSREVRNG